MLPPCILNSRFSIRHLCKSRSSAKNKTRFHRYFFRVRSDENIFDAEQWDHYSNQKTPLADKKFPLQKKAARVERYNDAAFWILSQKLEVMQNSQLRIYHIDCYLIKTSWKFPAKPAWGFFLLQVVEWCIKSFTHPLPQIKVRSSFPSFEAKAWSLCEPKRSAGILECRFFLISTGEMICNCIYLCAWFEVAFQQFNDTIPKPFFFPHNAKEDLHNSKKWTMERTRNDTECGCRIAHKFHTGLAVFKSRVLRLTYCAYFLYAVVNLLSLSRMCSYVWNMFQT